MCAGRIITSTSSLKYVTVLLTLLVANKGTSIGKLFLLRKIPCFAAPSQIMAYLAVLKHFQIMSCY